MIDKSNIAIVKMKSKKIADSTFERKYSKYRREIRLRITNL